MTQDRCAGCDAASFEFPRAVHAQRSADVCADCEHTREEHNVGDDDESCTVCDCEMWTIAL